VSGPSAGICLILDQGVPRDAAALHRAAGFGCDHVGELGLSRAEDTQILELARDRHATVVTLDADFHTILAVSEAKGPSVIRRRIQGLNGAKVANIVAQVVDRFTMELTRGCLVTVKLNKTTFHKLPVVAS